MNFARNFTALRKQKGLSQEQMAEKCGVSRGALAKWETGNTVPNLYLVSDIAKIFEVTVDELLNGKIDKQDNSMEDICGKLDEMQRKILLAIEKRDSVSDLYVQYCNIKNEYQGNQIMKEEFNSGEWIYEVGLEAASKGKYDEAIACLEEALAYGVVRAVDVLMSIHEEISDLFASEENESEFWAYKLKVAQKMQQYGRIMEEQIEGGRVVG